MTLTVSPLFIWVVEGGKMCLIITESPGLNSGCWYVVEGGGELLLPSRACLSIGVRDGPSSKIVGVNGGCGWDESVIDMCRDAGILTLLPIPVSEGREPAAAEARRGRAPAQSEG